MINKRVANLIALIVTIVWALSFVADVVIQNYEPSPYIHTVMLAVAGAAFARSVVAKDDKEEEK